MAHSILLPAFPILVKLLKSFYLNTRLFASVGAVAFLFALSYLYPILFAIAQATLASIGVLLLADILIVYTVREGIIARREATDKLSNGDKNPIDIYIENRYAFAARVKVIDELPFQFQMRDFAHSSSVPAGTTHCFRYMLRPVQRGEYHFGALNIFASSPLGLVVRRYRFEQDRMMPVYPSFLQMRAYELYAVSNRLTDFGIKKIRKIGHTMEFDQVRDYVLGDDVRTINWKATARHTTLMVNQYQDERSQQVFNVIDMSRSMKMPFEHLTLLDYAINTSLVLSNIAIRKQDKAGLLTFSDKMGTLLPAERRASHINKIMEVLYNQQTQFLESNYELLYANIMRKISQRSLLILYTNFETLSAMQRQLPYLRAIARHHLLVVVFFENTELRQALERPATTTEEITIKTIAEKFAYEKRQIVKEIERHGIHAILTAPQNLTVNALNKYLELKARGQI